MDKGSAYTSADDKAEELIPTQSSNSNYKQWHQMIIYSFFVLSGQSIATLLGRQYFDKGGNSKWMSTLVQTVGFPIILPFFFLPISLPRQNIADSHESPQERPKPLIIASFSAFLGIFMVVNCFMYSIGMEYLPVSTFSLICASQLGFNALFSYFLNSEKITPFVLNSLVLLTISSTLLVFTNDKGKSNKSTKNQYVVGFICTLGASAGYALMLSLTQLGIRKVLKGQNFKFFIELIVYVSVIATIAAIVGLFVSEDWKSLSTEMREFQLGKVSYVMNLVWTAISWQLFTIGTGALLFQVSSLFSNVISTLGLPIVPVLAVFVFQDKMTGVKVVSMVLAIWGFLSYIYQHYLDYLKSNEYDEHVAELAEVQVSERV